MNSTLFDVEHLQELTYERSRTWASLLESVSQNEDLGEIEVEDLDKIFGPECDKIEENDDELASMEDEECDNISIDSEILRTINNTTRLSMMFNNSATVVLPESTRNEELKLLDLFNQTLPIINEHKRQLKEFGFDRILSTFDKQKIEDKVGSWLNRHNSLYGGDSTLLACNLSQINKKEEELSKARKRMQGRTSGKDISHDSDDSLQSGETARYIRSSRAGAMKNSASTTTMIKTYRMVKSTREALREKYACEKLEDEYHLKSLRHRRRFANELEYHHNHYDLARQQRSRKSEKLQQICAASARKERRKVLRKRNYNNNCSMDTTSDSDSYYYDEDARYHRQHLKSYCNQNNCSGNYILKIPSTAVANRHCQRSVVKMPSARMNRMYYYSQSQTKMLSTSSSSNSFSSSCGGRRIIRRNLKCNNDNRPCKRESECQCCNERKLCDEYKHIVNSSTEEWYVENCYSPKKLLRTPVSLSKASNKSIPYETVKLPVVTELPNMDSKMKKNLKAHSEKNHTNNEDKIKLNSKKPTKEKSKTISSISDQQDDIFQFELQKAIKESKEFYEIEQQRKQKTKTKREILPSKPLRKSNKQQDKEEKNKTNRKRQTSKQSITADIAIDLENVEVLEKLPKLTKNKDKNIKSSTHNENKSTTTNATEETFFGNNQTEAICNSTALSGKSQAYNRQINDKLPYQLEETDENDATKEEIEKSKQTKTIKSKPSSSIRTNVTSSNTNKSHNNIKKAAANSTTVTSTTIRSPKSHSSLSTTRPLTATSTASTEITLDNDDSADCTLVTSTTNIEVPPTRQSHASEQDVEININTTNASTNPQDPTKGIIIYAPDNRSMAPAHSFTNDGYFTITKEHLSSIIGEKAAERFLKYYIGRKRFNSNSTVYFKPPTTKSSNSKNASICSDSDDDLESLGQYGDLYESLNKTS
ncbi:chromosome alignment defect 1 [Cochliomyia hominivorax]